MRRNRLFFAAIAFAFLCRTPLAQAGPPPGGWGAIRGINLGTSAAWVGGGRLENAFAPGLDLTFFQRIHTPLFFWVSTGARIWTAGGDTGVIPYVETGLSMMFLTAGVGTGAGFGAENTVPTWSVHLMLGVPIPVWAPIMGHLLFIEPYYRPTFNVSHDSFPTSHEVGILLKWFFMLSPRAE